MPKFSLFSSLLEHLLQVKRQLTTIAEDVAESRKAIEKETLKDVEGIIERLRTCESLRQSSIHHQVLLVDEELKAIERSVQRVEAANEDTIYGNTHGVLLSSSNNSPGLEMIRAPKAQIMVELIQNFADLTNQIERLSTKQINIQNEFATNDFPKETNERLEIISKCDSYLHAVKVFYENMENLGKINFASRVWARAKDSGPLGWSPTPALLTHTGAAPTSPAACCTCPARYHWRTALACLA